jgi:hypothetical protein
MKAMASASLSAAPRVGAVFTLREDNEAGGESILGGSAGGEEKRVRVRHPGEGRDLSG